MARLDAGEDPEKVLAGDPAPAKAEGEEKKPTTGTGEDDEKGKAPAEAAKPGEADPAKKAEGAEPEKGKSDDPKPGDTQAELRAKLASTEKALQDTQRWGHDRNAEVKRLEERLAALEAANRKAEREKKRPDLLDREPGLEEAIRYAAGKDEENGAGAAPGASPADGGLISEEAWADAVAEVHPDAADLLRNPVVKEHLDKARAAYGPRWRENPLIAIRELNVVKDTIASVNRHLAVEAAVRDHKRKAKERQAMNVPIGGDGQPAPNTDADAERYRTMSSEDFEKEKDRVLQRTG